MQPADAKIIRAERALLQTAEGIILICGERAIPNNLLKLILTLSMWFGGRIDSAGRVS